MKIVLPFRGELGIIIRFHVPAVAALEGDVIVCHEPGLEALYPDRQRVIVPRKEDELRGWKNDHADARSEGEFKAEWRRKLEALHPDAEFLSFDGRDATKVRRFVPKPYVEQLNPGDRWDVFIAPRKRKVAERRNWDAWPDVAERLVFSEGLDVFAGGARETSYDVIAHNRAWDYDRTLDACIEAMLRSKVVLATDAGLAHLAMLCGRPLIIVGANGGLVGPGERPDEPGPYWPIRMEHYYREANHMDAPLKMIPYGWHVVDEVIRVVREFVG